MELMEEDLDDVRRGWCSFDRSSEYIDCLE